MRIPSLLVALTFPALLGAQQVAPCGTERWPVKILTDDDRDSVSFAVELTSIAALVTLPPPRESRHQRERLSLERRTFRVRAILVEQKFEASDGDIHLILADPADRSRVLIAEIPDSSCARGSRQARAFAEARRAAELLSEGIEIEVTGIAFWDDEHGQSGSAPNGVELHPVILVVPVLNKNDILRIEVGADPPDPSEVRVWLNLSSKVYHCPGSPYYGNTTRGNYMPESAAIRAGGRPSGGRPCR